jgi:hypothetical protein
MLLLIFSHGVKNYCLLFLSLFILKDDTFYVIVALCLFCKIVNLSNQTEIFTRRTKYDI